MTASLPPGALLVLGALLVPFARGRLRPLWLVLVPTVSTLHLLAWFEVPAGSYLQIELFDYVLTLARVDKLALAFGLVFHLVTLIGAIYALHVRDTLQCASALLYAGAAVAAVFAGDLLTLFVWWELTAVGSVPLIWASRTERAYGAGMRYLVIQVGSGVLLLSGTILHHAASGSLEFGPLALGTPGGSLIFLAFGIKCAFPLLHNWLQDSYPEATATGTVFLSAFTTKLAVYALARGFAGTGVLLWIGVAMTLFPIFYAVIENDLRRTLAYSLNNQLGFMVAGIGIGTEMSLNGTVAHAFCHILYKALLFMSMGAVLHRTGTVKSSELGGLVRSMPWTAGFCIVGAMSISAFPFLSGFVSKGLILDAASHEHLALAWVLLLVASAGVMEHSGLKVPYFAFFGHDSGIRCQEAPWNMRIGMGLAAALCVGIGLWPWALYRLLPYGVDWQPYTAAHVVAMYQLLLFAALAFGVLLRLGLYPREVPSINLDSDWLYRKWMPEVIRDVVRARERLGGRLGAVAQGRMHELLSGVYRHHGPAGVFARTWATGSSVLWVLALLTLVLILYYA